jgi:pimeloyl-ACP methyl ester carboxylesterase
VRPGTIVLCHSPLTTSAAWGDLADELERRGRSTLVIDVQEDEQPPYAMRYVAHAAIQLASVSRTDPVVLVGHSGAGPLLPRIGFARRAAHSAVGAYVFFDASLPGTGMMTRLELLRREHSQSADELAAVLDAGGRFPN